jgi:hypothetical protein
LDDFQIHIVEFIHNTPDTDLALQNRLYGRIKLDSPPTNTSPHGSQYYRLTPQSPPLISHLAAFHTLFFFHVLLKRYYSASSRISKGQGYQGFLRNA